MVSQIPRSHVDAVRHSTSSDEACVVHSFLLNYSVHLPLRESHTNVVGQGRHRRRVRGVARVPLSKTMEVQSAPLLLQASVMLVGLMQANAGAQTSFPSTRHIHTIHWTRMEKEKRNIHGFFGLTA
jgi:hypothetical protein